MGDLKFDSNRTIRTFKIGGEAHELVRGQMPTLVDEGEIYKIHVPGSHYEFHGGFRKVVIEIQADASKTIVQFYAVLDLFYLRPSYLIQDNDPIKLGRVIYSGNLVDGAGGKKKWNTSIIVSTPYNQANSDELPDNLRKLGTGTVITSIVQSLFGTIAGIKLLGLEDYHVPDAEGGTSDIKVTN